MQINLLPDVVLARRREAQIKRVATTALVGWFGVLVVVSLLSLGYQQFESKQLASVKTKEAALDAQVNSPQNKAFRAEAQEVQASLKALDQLFNHQQRMTVIESRLAQLTPKEIQLHNVQIDPSGRIQISGTADSYADAGKFVVALKDSKEAGEVYFTDVVLNGASLGEKGTVAFSLTTTMVYPDQSAGGQK